MSNKNASDGAGCSKHTQQPPQQQTEGEDMELIEEDNEVSSMASDNVEDTEISLSEMRSALPPLEPSSLPAVETSSLTSNLREQIKQTMKTQKPLPPVEDTEMSLSDMESALPPVESLITLDNLEETSMDLANSFEDIEISSSEMAGAPPADETLSQSFGDSVLAAMEMAESVDTEMSSSEIPSALTAVETSSLREQIKQTMKTQKPLVKIQEMWDISGMLVLSKEEFDNVISLVLNSEERRKLSEAEVVEADVYDEQLTKKYPMIMYYASYFELYVFSSLWSTFIRELGLKSDEDTLTLWAFRHYRTGELSFYRKFSKTTEPETRKTQVPASPKGPSDVL